MVPSINAESISRPLFAQHIGCYRGQLYIGGFQHFLHAIDLSRTLLDQTLAVSAEIAQFTSRGRWNETGFEQPMAQQIGEPFAIFNIGLATWNGFHMLSIDQDDAAALFQQVKHRSEVNSGRFHGDHCDGQAL